MSDQDIRWRQRFGHFEKAFLLLQDAIGIEKPSVVERAGLIQFFEMAFELGWKLLKDFEEAEGIVVKTPREAIEEALKSNLISQGQHWTDVLEGRKLTTQTYDEEIARAVEQKIREKYFVCLQQLRQAFSVRAAAICKTESSAQQLHGIKAQEETV
jgi:nucleotidyltransferase substrate binding protein (TIGR01987 family)